MDIRVDKHFSSCFTTWNDDGEKNGTCAGGAATEARSPSTVRQHLHGSLVEGAQHICGPRNVQKVGAEMQITFAAPKMLRCFVTLVRFVLIHGVKVQ